MGMIEDTNYIDDEIYALRDRLVDEGMDLDLVLACMVCLVAEGYSNMEGAEGQSNMLRRTADEMDAGEFKHKPERPRPKLTVINGRGEVKS